MRLPTERSTPLSAFKMVGELDGMLTVFNLLFDQMLSIG
jgi:hypothetical protein